LQKRFWKKGVKKGEKGTNELVQEKFNAKIVKKSGGRRNRAERVNPRREEPTNRKQGKGNKIMSRTKIIPVRKKKRRWGGQG